VEQIVGMRVAHPEDYDRIAAVLDGWWGRSVSGALPRLFLDHFCSTSRIVEDQDGLAAVLAAFVSSSQPHLAYVHFVGERPGRRRSGLARGLYEEFARYAQGQGCTELRAITSPGNTGSIRFHQRLGFSASEVVSDYNGPARPAVLFSRSLGPATDP
jgi:ribosomal protein S18 acetylase RimI-like enzyme